MIEWYKKVVFENYANFSGRARRSEYWYFILVNMIINFLLFILIALFTDNDGGVFSLLINSLLFIYSLAVIIPTIAVTVRRLHDIGKSGWFYFIAFVPLVGGILLLIWLATEGEKHNNNWGSDPKSDQSEIDSIGNM